ncbi:MAG TPA: four-carbon acid sugar kinase family protein, partial [Acetobacteraceae bacterium]|nr:four-carbon acid sugar kinase family protein [Acetobacteraceae bacterium]
MTTLRLLADDLTGALDTAAELVGLAGPVPAFWHGAIPRDALPPNAALDSGTREMEPGPASGIVAALTPALAGADIAYKKIDSLLRGPTLAEIASCLRAGPWERAVLAPAFPYQGRVTQGGVQHARGADGRWAAVGGDIVAGLRAQLVPAQPGRLDASLPTGITVFDAATDEDLRLVAALGKAAPCPVLWIGTGGLAQALAGSFAPSTRAALNLPVLGLFGSDQDVTCGQLDACGPDWIRLRDGGRTEAIRIAAHLRANGRALASLDLPAGLARDEAARRIAAELSRLVRDLPPPGTLIVAGGETLRGLCLALG